MVSVVNRYNFSGNLQKYFEKDLTNAPDGATINPKGGVGVGEKCDIFQKIKNKISSMPKNIRKGQQNKHILGTKEYNDYVERQKAKCEYGPSYINGDLKFAQELVNKYSGIGEPRVKNGKWLNYEMITVSENIGIVVNNLNGSEIETNKFKIHYSDKYGTHVVPDYPSKKGK